MSFARSVSISVILALSNSRGFRKCVRFASLEGGAGASEHREGEGAGC